MSRQHKLTAVIYKEDGLWTWGLHSKFFVLRNKFPQKTKNDARANMNSFCRRHNFLIDRLGVRDANDN